jgi:Ni/Fe-hydrogenase subunit HybB-like protein
LKSNGYLPNVNDNHLHDLGKFMFGFSVFWTYLWFSQFMLIWYSNIPEEVVYFMSRIEDYTIPFWGMVVINFVLPFLLLVSSSLKRVNWILVMAGIVILVGHYMDVFNMIMPSAVGDQWFFGIPELGSVMFFSGLFIYIVFSSLTKAPLEASGDPFNKESEKFVY